MQALEIAKRSAEPLAIANASKLVLGSAMREMGNLQFARGSATAAIETYRRANDFDDSVNARIDLAQAYLRAQNSDKALPIVTDVLVNDPDNARAWFVEGEVWMARKWFEEAAKSFHRALSRKEDSAAWYLLGAALLQMNQRDEARAAFHNLGQESARPNLHRLLADAYSATNDTEDSVREYRLAGVAGETKTHAASIESVLNNASHFHPSGESSPGNHAQVLQLESRLRTILANTLNDLGAAEAQQQLYSLALAHFHEAATWNADVPGLLRNTGIAAARVQDYEEGIRALRPVVNANPGDRTARALLGTSLFATHSCTEAVEIFKPLGDSALQLHELTYSWASCLIRLNRYPEAQALLTKLGQQQLTSNMLILVGQLWSQMGDYEKTVKLCRRALQLDPKILQAHYFAGLSLLRLNRPADAEQELRAELQLDPENAETQYNLAFTLLQQSKNEEAASLWKELLDRNPDHPEANYELGKELLAQKKTEESLPYLEASVRLRPQFEPAHYQLQSAYRAVGRKEDADREAKIYRELKSKSRNITLPPPHEPGASPASPTGRP